MNGRLAARLGGGRLKLKKKLIKKRKNAKIDEPPTNSSFVSEVPNHHVVFNNKTTTEMPISEESSDIDLQLQEQTNEDNTESQEDILQTTTVSVSTTSTISSVSGIERTRGV